MMEIVLPIWPAARQDAVACVERLRLALEETGQRLAQAETDALIYAISLVGDDDARRLLIAAHDKCSATIKRAA